jgi:hypothetical protein
MKIYEMNKFDGFDSENGVKKIKNMLKLLHDESIFIAHFQKACGGASRLSTPQIYIYPLNTSRN